jgi:hypothetical protein
MAGSVAAAPPATTTSEGELEKLWSELADWQPRRAHRAMARLEESPAQTVGFLAKKLRPEHSADPAHIEALVAQLDDDDFAVRNGARKELEMLGKAAEPALQQALERNPSLNLAYLITGLLGRLDAGPLVNSSDSLRKLRAVAVLERIGTPDARNLLESLASGADWSSQTREARQALARLKMQNRSSISDTKP